MLEPDANPYESPVPAPKTDSVSGRTASRIPPEFFALALGSLLFLIARPLFVQALDPQTPFSIRWPVRVLFAWVFVAQPMTDFGFYLTGWFSCVFWMLILVFLVPWIARRVKRKA